MLPPGPYIDRGHPLESKRDFDHSLSLLIEQTASDDAGERSIYHEEIFQLLERQFSPFIRITARKMRVDEDDVMQEFLVSILRRLPTLRTHTGTLRSYCMQVAYTHCVHEYRKKLRYQALKENTLHVRNAVLYLMKGREGGSFILPLQKKDGVVDPLCEEEPVVRDMQSLRLALDQAVTSIPDERDREIFLEFMFSDQTLDSIAQNRGMSKARSTQLFTRAVVELRRSLRQAIDVESYDVHDPAEQKIAASAKVYKGSGLYRPNVISNH